MKSAVLVSAAFACIVAASSTQAQDLKTRAVITNSKTQVAEHLASTNQTCGTHITMNVDYSTFSDVLSAPENTNQQAPWSFIVNVTDALDTLCGSADGKAAVQAKIKTITVKHAKTESESLSGTTFSYAVPYTGASVQTILTYLQGKM